MAFTLTNNLDDVAIYIGLKRFPGETDELFSSRIKRFSKVKYGSDAETIILSTLEQIGLRTKPVAIVKCIDPYTMHITKDYFILESFPVSGNGEYIKVFINIGSTVSENTIGSIIQDIVTASNTYSIEIIDNDFSNLTRETILNSSNSQIVQDVVSKRRTRFQAVCIIPESLTSKAQLVANRVDSLQDIKYTGDYFIDGNLAYLELANDPSSAFSVAYTSYEKYAVIYKTEFNLIPLDIYAKYGLSDNFIYLLDEYLKGKVLG